MMQSKSAKMAGTVDRFAGNSPMALWLTVPDWSISQLVDYSTDE
jgi:hypothetical protein